MDANYILYTLVQIINYLYVQGLENKNINIKVLALVDSHLEQASMP